MLALVVVGMIIGRASDSTPSERVAALADLVWRHDTEGNGFARIRAGLPVEHLPNFTEAGSRRNAAFWAKVRTALIRLPARGLSGDDIITRAVIAWQADRAAEAARFYWFPSRVTPYDSPMNGLHQLFAALPVGTDADRRRYLALVGEYAGVVAALRRKLEGQVRRRLVLTKPDVDLTIPLWQSRLLAAHQMPLWVKEARFAGVADPDRVAFQASLEQALTGPVAAALDSMVRYLTGPYLAAAPARVGQWQYGLGKDYYRSLVRLHTTRNITPEAVFRIGHQQIDSLLRELDAVRREVGFVGTTPEFQESLRTEPRFFVSDPAAVGGRLEGYVKTMETKVDSLFGWRPKAPYGVERLAADLEPNMTYGYYDEPRPNRPAGIYYYNGSNLQERNLGMAEGLAYHELVPGHHFHIATQRENKALSRYRQDQESTAFAEGWGDYASMLGRDAGLYRDPYSRAGRLMMEMMLATRLVLDVGLNYYGWTLERARAFMKEHTLETERQIATETLRYGADIPGQGLAYRIGSLTIRGIRDRAKARLGPHWDVRKFHQTVLSLGMVPMDVLAREIDRFVARENAQ